MKSLWKLPLWTIAIGNLMGLFGLALGATLVALGYVSPTCLLMWAGGHLVFSLLTSVGLHRYFAHSAFKTSRFWHNVLTFGAPLLLLGSPIDWAVTHLAHHKYSDTDRDPHIEHWTYIFWKRYRAAPVDTRQLRRLVKDPSIRWVHRNDAYIWLLAAVVICMLPWQVVLFGYLMPLGSVHLIGAVHLVWNHGSGSARDWPLLEYVLPASGEWNHLTHHRHWGRADMRNAWWHLDLGALLIRRIAVPGSIR